MRSLSIALIIISTALSFSHGWSAFNTGDALQAKMMEDLGIKHNYLPYIGIFSIAVGLMLLFPQTFYYSNVLNALTILVIIILCLKGGNIKLALMEVPFLAMPLILIWLKHPVEFLTNFK